MILSPFKDPDEVLDYGVNWEPRLSAEDDEIDTSTFIIEQSSVTIEDSPAPAIVGFETKAWLSGGVLGEVALVTNRITTTGGRTWDETLKIRIRTR